MKSKIGSYIRDTVSCISYISKKILRQLKYNGRSMVRFEAVYRLLTFFVIFPLLIYSERILLIINRKTNIAWYNTSSILKNPLTWLFGVFLVLLITFFAVLEQIAVSDAIQASESGIEKKAEQILVDGIDQTIVHFRPRNWMLRLYFILIMHFSRPYDASSITRNLSVPGFVNEHMDKYPAFYVLYIGLLILALYFDLRWSFALPVMAARHVSFPDARKESARLTKGVGNKLQILLITALCALVCTGLYYVLTYAVSLLVFLVTKWLEPSTSFMSYWHNRNRELISIFLYLIYTWVTSVLVQIVIQNLWYHRLENDREAVPAYIEIPDFIFFRKWVKPVTAVVLCTILFFSVPSRYQQVKWMVTGGSSLPMIMAHRGYSSAAPENTIDAFEKAIEAGAEAAELDVQMTKDGVIVVMHDDSPKRTAGLDKYIWEVTYSEIKDLDNSLNFSGDYGPTRIPTLDEVIKTAKGRLYLNIEIKRTGHDDGIVEKVVRIIQNNGFEDECDITSQDYDTLAAVKAIDPGILTAYTTVIGIGDIENLDAADIISIEETFATFREILNIHTAGKRVFVWTVNEEKSIDKLVNLNVDAIITNEIETGIKVIDKHQNRINDLYQRLRQVMSFL